MIDINNFKSVLTALGFEETRLLFSKHFPEGDFYLKVNFSNGQIIYPEAQGLKINDTTTCNFSATENFVVFECVHRLLMKGYKPKHIELEPKWTLGHSQKGGKADILVRNQQDKPLLLIECKTAGKEFEKAWKDTLNDGAQLFSYVEQEKDVEFMCLYAADFDDKTNRISTEQRIVSHRDNLIILDDDPKLTPFAAAKNVKERFKVWKETYKGEFTENGIFEENILPYQIGKEKYTLEVDTKTIAYFDIKGKYHQFRTILRKYNVSRRENAFEVLVNLFLCKLVDEIENPFDLKFYWKGIAYDNYFDLVDRLQALYKVGMENFLAQQITYISNEEIENAFWATKQKRNATKIRIKELFKTLKFFNDNNFGFISVKNKESFDRNAKILLEIIQMWQGLRLKTKEQNQFLGDMFEFFLDNGIKQSEGQFFTPMPICKFIVMSLPLTQQLQQNPQPLKVIDYACGSGHFLTEYALQIEPLVRQFKQMEPNAYYKSIFGIEKEDRLAKVAKVSAFMYGRDEINVLDADALATIPAIQNESFDILIANPPFAVEDFLLTLDETDRSKYDLLKSVNDLGNKNIQCFFLERAKQLLAPNGTIGVIVPSSVLSNSDAMHIATREILLKYFDFVSIVELGSSTFGKTGTNTVVLFLRRKPQRPEPAEQFWNRTLDFFEHWDEELAAGGGEYLDIEVVQKYCQQIEIPFAAYQHLLRGDVKAVVEQLVTNYEIFKDYKTEFDTKKAKDFKNVKNRNDADLNKQFLKYVQDVEQQKLYYFMLAHHNAQKVLLIKSPADGKEQKVFLGYEWSGAKGNEGIKYNGGDTLSDIITPMFDPKNLHNPLKINTLIQQNFQGDNPTIPEHLQPFASFARLADLLDFSRKDFNKAFSLTPKKNREVETKWDLVKLGDFVETLNGLWTGKKPPFTKVSVIRNTNFTKDGKFDLTDVAELDVEVSQYQKRKLQYGDIIIEKSGGSETQAVGRVILFDKHEGEFSYSNFTSRIRLNSNKFIANYLHIFLNSIYQLGYTFDLQNGMSGIKNLDFERYLSMKIPLPPLSVQQQIVTECERIDAAASNAQAEIAAAKQEMANLLINDFPKEKLNNVTNRVSDNIDPQSQTGDVNYIGLENIESQTGNLVGSINAAYQSIKSAKTVFKQGDILYGKLRPNLNKVYLAKEDGICSTDILVFRFKQVELTKYYMYYLLSNPFNQEVLKSVSGQQLPRTSWTDMKEIRVPVPPLSEQTTLLKAIATLESRIAAAQTVIRVASAQKQGVLKAHL